jgi:hypothetical protein
MFRKMSLSEMTVFWVYETAACVLKVQHVQKVPHPPLLLEAVLRKHSFGRVDSALLMDSLLS